MPSTYTTNLGIEKIATGEQSGTWGDTTNTNFDLIDQAVNGVAVVTLASAGTSGSPNDLDISDGASSDGRNKHITFNDGADLGASAYVRLVPNDAEKVCFIANSLSGSRDLILFQGTYNSARDLVIPAGQTMIVKFDGGGTTATVTEVAAGSYLPLSGGTLTGDLNFGDNVKAVFGAGSDLQIYHSGTQNYITDNGTGNLYFQSNGSGFIFQDSTPNTYCTMLTVTGGVSLKFVSGGTSTTRIDTTSYGADINGTLGADGFRLDVTANSWTFSDDGSSNLIIAYNGTDLMKLDTSGNLTVVGNITAYGTI